LISESRNRLVPDRLRVNLWITPLIVDWSVEAILLFTRVSGTSIVVITLSRDNAGDTSSVLVTLSEPACLVCRRKFVKVLVKDSLVSCARLVGVRALEGLVVRGSSASVGCAFVLIVTSLDVLAESVFWHADIQSARVLVVTSTVVSAFWLASAYFLRSRCINIAIAPFGWIRVCAVRCECAKVGYALLVGADGSKGAVWAISASCASSDAIFVCSWNDFASSESCVANCLVAMVESLCKWAVGGAV